jgi:hypothetical protein
MLSATRESLDAVHLDVAVIWDMLVEAGVEDIIDHTETISGVDWSPVGWPSEFYDTLWYQAGLHIARQLFSHYVPALAQYPKSPYTRIVDGAEEFYVFTVQDRCRDAPSRQETLIALSGVNEEFKQVAKRNGVLARTILPVDKVPPGTFGYLSYNLRELIYIHGPLWPNCPEISC